MKKNIFVIIVLILSSYQSWAGTLGQGALLIKEISGNGIIPIVVFDLDETIVNSAPRRYLSYLEALSNEILIDDYPDLVKLAKKMTLFNIEKLKNTYDTKKLFNSLGIFDNIFIKRVFDIMFPIYLSNKYMLHDQVIPGANAYIRLLMQNGAFVVFISSRYEATQKKGTILSLKKHKFIKRGDSYKIILRPQGMSSIDFKNMAFKKVAGFKIINGTRAKVALVFENEPENMNAMLNWFTDAKAYFVKGAYIKKEKLEKNVENIRDYL